VKAVYIGRTIFLYNQISSFPIAGLLHDIAPEHPDVQHIYSILDLFSGLMSYTILYNLLNCPAGVVPVTTVTQDDVDGFRDYKGHYGDSWDANVKEVRKTCHRLLVFL